MLEQLSIRSNSSNVHIWISYHDIQAIFIIAGQPGTFIETSKRVLLIAEEPKDILDNIFSKNPRFEYLNLLEVYLDTQSFSRFLKEVKTEL